MQQPEYTPHKFCINCGQEIKMMCRKGTDFCCEQCKEDLRGFDE